MYKLLIVDDEPIIVDGLYDMFKEWDAYQLDVYKAYSGAEALEWLARKRIDVVVTDIRMPGIDGMQLLERIRRSWPDCKVVFLTGYDEFEYVYKAIQYDGVSYLLKTESYGKIAETVGGCIEQIRKSMKDEQLAIEAKSRLERALPVLQKEFLSDLTEGAHAGVDQAQLDDLGIPLRAESPVTLIAGLVNEASGPAADSGRSLPYSVHYLVEKYISPFASTAFSVHRNYMLWIVQEKEPTDEARSAQAERSVYRLKGILESAQAVGRETLGARVTFVVADAPVAWTDVAERFAALRTALNYSNETGMDAVLVDTRDAFPDEGGRSSATGISQSVKLQLKKLDALETYLEQGKKEAFVQTFRDIRVALAHNSGHSAVSFEIFYSLSLLFLSYMNRHGMWETAAFKADYEKLTRFERHASLEEAFPFFEQAAVRVFESQNVELEKRSALSVQRIMRHIQDNPGGDLSLSSLADLVHFNPKYLSRLFKQESGTNLSDYISEVKLNHVKELLAQNKLKVHEIAERVGYYSAPCFTRFFKRATGNTPQEFRDSALQTGGVNW